MLPLEWYRNFVAVYRSGSVSGAARARSLTQPAVSQQLAALEAAIGVPLFDRTARGMTPTARGEALYAQVFDALDRLEQVGRGLLPKAEPAPTLRLGASPELFHEFALPRLAPLGYGLSVCLGGDRDLLAQVETGALDAALTTQKPSARTLQHRTLGERPYVLIGAADAPRPPAETTLAGLGRWLNGQPWISYSEERPVTRRFWQQVLESRFDARPRLVVPDLRSVVRAVELGMGFGIVPEYACRRVLDEGRVRELWPVSGLILPERSFLAYRDIHADREEIRQIGIALSQR